MSDYYEDEDYEMEDELIEAAESGDLNAFHELVEKGVDLNYQDPEDGSTAAINAAWNGHAAFLSALVNMTDDNGDPIVDLNIQSNDGSTAATCAAWTEHEECVRILASANDKDGKPRVDFAIQDNEGGDAYDCAAEKGNQEIMDIVEEAESRAAKPIVSLKSAPKSPRK